MPSPPQSRQASPVHEAETEQRQLVIHANYEIFVSALTILQVVNSVLWVLERGQPAQQVVIPSILAISLFLICDFIYRLRRTPIRHHRVIRFRGGLLLLGSLPIPFFALFRLAWYGLVTHTLRRTDFDAMGGVVIEKRAQSTLLAALLAAIVVLEVATILIIDAESQSPQANIQNVNDAVWWTIVTMATVGYGDKYPVTTSGRVIGIFVMIVGVGLFSVLTSFLAHSFVRSGQRAREKVEGAPASSEDYRALTAKLDALSALLEQQGTTQQDEAAELRARLAQIERLLAQGSARPSS